jgi:hypothetical protein
MATLGPTIDGLAVDNTSTGTTAWSISGTALLNDAATTFASLNLSSNAASHFLILRNFGFAVPSGATINGITVSHRTYLGGASLLTFTARLWNGTSTTTNNALGTAKTLATTFTNTFAVYSAGATNDVWGATLTDTIVNSAGFGIAFNCVATPSPTSQLVIMDYITVTVTYTAGATFTQSAVIMCGM